MDSPEFARNLYVAHHLEPVTRARLADWDAGLREAPRLPGTRWRHRRDAFLRAASTSASTRIEGNQLSLWRADELLAGMRVEGAERDQQEVRNYSEALDTAAGLASRESFAWHELVLQQSNAAVLHGLANDTGGAYRSGSVSVGGGFYSAPHATVVPRLVAVLIDWLRSTDAHPLIRSALLHLNLVAIHPWFDGNGRTARIACLLDLDRVVHARELISLEPALAADQGDYFRHIRDALGMSWDPENHVATDWVDWYVGLHLDALAAGRAVVEATNRDVMVILAALERRGEPADWGPIILTAGFGSFAAGIVGRMYGNSASAARAMLGRLVAAGWLVAEGRTRGRRYHPSALVDALGLGSPAAARRWARADGADDGP